MVRRGVFFALCCGAIFFLGMFPDRATAQRRGCEVIVYWDIDFGGEARRITHDLPYVGDHWNDQISSMRVIAGVWEFYWDIDYGGEMMTRRPGAYRFVGDHWNDQISSLRCVRPTRPID
jgi:Beta/Gamma crystallin